MVIRLDVASASAITTIYDRLPERITPLGAEIAKTHDLFLHGGFLEDGQL